MLDLNRQPKGKQWWPGQAQYRRPIMQIDLQKRIQGPRVDCKHTSLRPHPSVTKSRNESRERTAHVLRCYWGCLHHIGSFHCKFSDCSHPRKATSIWEINQEIQSSLSLCLSNTLNRIFLKIKKKKSNSLSFSWVTCFEQKIETLVSSGVLRSCVVLPQSLPEGCHDKNTPRQICWKWEMTCPRGEGLQRMSSPTFRSKDSLLVNLQ